VKNLYSFVLMGIIPILLWILSLNVPVVEQWLNAIPVNILIINLFGLLNIIVITITTLSHNDYAEQNKELKKILTNKDYSYNITHSELYVNMKKHTQKSVQSINIMSLRKTLDNLAIDFYKNLFDLLSKNHKIILKLVIKNTDNNKIWINELVRKGKNKHNFLLA